MNTEISIAAVFAALALIAVVVILELRKTPREETELTKREDRAMSKVKDDPGEVARWVP